MASTIQAFVSIPALSNNDPNVVATIGEMSTDSRTFATEKQYVGIDSAPNMSLVIFKALTDGVPVSGVTGEFCAPALDLVHLIRTQYDNTTSLLEFLGTHADAKYTNFVLGEVITQNGVHLPRSLHFTHTDNNFVTFDLWLSDETFQNEYQGTEIKILAPCFPVTSLYQPYEGALAAINGTPYPVLAAKEEELRGKYPYTKRSVYELRWNDPADLSKSFTTYWTALGYGPQSSRTDLILDAIKKYLEDNSPYTVDEWKFYLPDIKSIEIFEAVPFWDAVAMTAGPGLDSLYRTAVRFNTVVSTVTAVMPSRTVEEVEALSEYIPILYRKLGMVIMGGASNADGREYFTELFPDYTLIDLNDQNADRLDEKTQSVIQTLELLVRAAEVDTGVQVLPTGMTRRTIGGATFLEKSDNNVIYRVCTRQSYINLVGGA